MDVMIWGFLIIAISLAPCIYAWLFFRKQKAICQKYPFFSLRDKIILEIVNSDTPEPLMKTYDLINFVAAKLKVSIFGIKFFVDVMAEKLSSMIEKQFQLALKSPLHEIEKVKLNKFQKELAELILMAARKNSLLLKIAMTRIGFRILFLPIAIKGCYQILKRHRHLVDSFLGKYAKIALKYSFLAQSIRSPSTPHIQA